MAGVETTSYVGGLVEANPTPEDFISQGDDHLRLIKTVLRNTFPGFSRAIDGALIPWQTTPDDTSVYQKFLNHDGQLGTINDFISPSNPLGALLRANNNLSDVQDAATALANLGGVAATGVLLKANNLSDLADPAEARGNLGVLGQDDALIKTSNLADVPDKAIARVNLEVPAASAVLLKASNLSDVASKPIARANLEVPSLTEAALNANNLAYLADKAVSRANLEVWSIAQVADAINTAIFALPPYAGVATTPWDQTPVAGNVVLPAGATAISFLAGTGPWPATYIDGNGFSQTFYEGDGAILWDDATGQVLRVPKEAISAGQVDATVGGTVVIDAGTTSLDFTGAYSSTKTIDCVNIADGATVAIHSINGIGTVTLSGTGLTFTGSLTPFFAGQVGTLTRNGNVVHAAKPESVLNKVQEIESGVPDFIASQFQYPSLLATTTAVNTRLAVGDVLEQFILSGLDLTMTGGLNTTLSAGVAYIGGEDNLAGSFIPVGRIVRTADNLRTHLTFRDTYVDLTNLGYGLSQLNYETTSNGNPPPTQSLASLRLWKIVTNGTDVTSIERLAPTQPTFKTPVTVPDAVVAGDAANKGQLDALNANDVDALSTNSGQGLTLLQQSSAQNNLVGAQNYAWFKANAASGYPDGLVVRCSDRFVNVRCTDVSGTKYWIAQSTFVEYQAAPGDVVTSTIAETPLREVEISTAIAGPKWSFEVNAFFGTPSGGGASSAKRLRVSELSGGVSGAAIGALTSTTGCALEKRSSAFDGVTIGSSSSSVPGNSSANTTTTTASVTNTLAPVYLKVTTQNGDTSVSQALIRLRVETTPGATL